MIRYLHRYTLAGSMRLAYSDQFIRMHGRNRTDLAQILRQAMVLSCLGLLHLPVFSALQCLGKTHRTLKHLEPEMLLKA